MAILHSNVKAPGQQLFAVADWNANHTIQNNTITPAQTTFSDQQLKTTSSPTFDDLTLSNPSNIYTLDHNSFTNTHNLTTDIDHNTITNTHNLTTDIDHNTITNTHNLTTDIDHNQLTNYAANEHIDWTNASDNFKTTGTINSGEITSTGSVIGAQLRTGTNDVAAGMLMIFGDGTGSRVGGRMRFYLADDYDTAFDYYRFEAYDDDLRLFPVGAAWIHTFFSDGNVKLANNLRVDGGKIGITADTDLLQLASGALTVNGTLNSGAITSTGNLSITGKATIDQSSSTAGVPVLTLDQADTSEEFIKFIGTSDSDPNHSFVPPEEIETPLLSGYIRIYIEDVGEEIDSGIYFIPFYKETP